MRTYTPELYQRYKDRIKRSRQKYWEFAKKSINRQRRNAYRNGDDSRRQENQEDYQRNPEPKKESNKNYRRENKDKLNSRRRLVRKYSPELRRLAEIIPAKKTFFNGERTRVNGLEITLVEGKQVDMREIKNVLLLSLQGIGLSPLYYPDGILCRGNRLYLNFNVPSGYVSEARAVISTIYRLLRKK